MQRLKCRSVTVNYMADIICDIFLKGKETVDSGANLSTVHDRTSRTGGQLPECLYTSEHKEHLQS